MTDVAVRPYQADDESAWVRCRTLSFLNTSYFDDVLTAKPSYDLTSIELVATSHEVGSTIVGVLDVTVDDKAATIETIATHPDHERRGIASSMLSAALRSLSGVDALEAWTRDDVSANGWYQARGFVETFRYLHVYASSDAEAAEAVPDPALGLIPVRGFFHANIDREDELRDRFRRVHVCRRYELSL